MHGRRCAAICVFLGAIGVIGAPPAIAQSSGADVYQRTCRACHENPDGRTPAVEALRAMTSARILRTLDFGSMMTVAYPLRRDEREAVAAFLGKAGPEPEPSPAAFCTDRRVSLDLTERAWNGWSPTSNNTRFVPNTVSGIAAADVPNLRLKWAFGFAGDISAFAQPTVIGDHIFVGSAGGVVHALSAASGCLRWIFQAAGPIRSSIVAAPIDGGHVLLFGDLTGWFYALDAATGQLLWKKRPEEHEAVRLSAPPVVVDGLAIIPVASWEESRALNTVYACCTFRGSLTALRIRDGSEAWKTYMVPTTAQPTGKAASGADTLRTVRCRHLGNTDAGSRTPASVRRDRQQLLASGHVAQRLGGGRRSRHRADRVVDASPCRTTSTTRPVRRRPAVPRAPREAVQTMTSDRLRFS